MTFYVGQRIICIDDEAHQRYVPRGMRADDGGMDGLSKGSIYTVRDVGMLGEVIVCRLKEISRQRWYLIGEEGWYAQARFRPVTDRKSEVSFTLGADPESEAWDNRKKVRTRVRDRRSPVRF
jgi:hypothetical protein